MVLSGSQTSIIICNMAEITSTELEIRPIHGVGSKRLFLRVWGYVTDIFYQGLSKPNKGNVLL